MAIVNLQDAIDLMQFGGKAVNLGRMLRAGLPVPPGFAVSVEAFTARGKLSEQAAEKLKAELVADKVYAVRSSATVEDADGASWAGQFESYLDVAAADVPDKVETCHNSTKARAHAYAENAGTTGNFHVAVVVQEMLRPTLAGVLFTKNPVGSPDEAAIEYVEGVGESLVQGEADPARIIWNKKLSKIVSGDQDKQFALGDLLQLADKVESEFGVPQDIEWALAQGKLWLVQTRPITTVASSAQRLHLGDPSELFYWGPVRALPLYMSDFMLAEEQNFKRMYKDPGLPNPPESIVLFRDKQMVWLSNVQAFDRYVRGTFMAYEQQAMLQQDIAQWEKLRDKADSLVGSKSKILEALIRAWQPTLIPEMALYGAESVIAERLSRFDPEHRQRVWQIFTLPDKPGFLQRIDNELRESADPILIAEKYPWIQDGYQGVRDDAAGYFTKRLEVIRKNSDSATGSVEARSALAQELNLDPQEVHLLTVARQLAAFMDERKAWMMRTRRYLQGVEHAGPKHGWHYRDNEVSHLDEEIARELWRRYIDFKASGTALVGVVASSGNKEFINGVVALVNSPTDIVEDDKILVVPSTSPSYVPLMRKARALITDHGGMMSHAAIVAREFGLPSIVGTKQATKVLKTGDKVVLDLVKGEINR